MDKHTKAIMARQAAQARAVFESATPAEPLTLSPSLYDKLRPEHRASYRRG